ncbi:MAG: hypothetical protein JW737_03720, partial [Acidobacteria bacterium]|nr:hypothetical protein [Acidobacteriota bacterium]
SLMLAQLTNPKLAGDIQITPAYPNVSQSITFKVRVLVKNEPVDNLVLRGFIDGIKFNEKIFQGTTQAGYDAYIELQWTNLTAGSHTVSFTLDPDNLITEEDETDNHLEKTFSVMSGSLAAVDYKIKKNEPKVNPNYALVNDKPANIYVNPSIKRNLTITGNKKIWNIYGYVKSEFHDLDKLTVDIRIDSSTYSCSDRMTLTNFKAGQEKKVEISCEAPDGTYIATILADPTNVLLEKDRSDNIRIKSLSLEYTKQ